MCHYLKGAPASNNPPSHLSSPDLFRLKEHAVLFSARLGSQGKKEKGGGGIQNATTEQKQSLFV